jgi:hypothetical protein
VFIYRHQHRQLHRSLILHVSQILKQEMVNICSGSMENTQFVLRDTKEEKEDITRLATRNETRLVKIRLKSYKTNVSAMYPGI